MELNFDQLPILGNVSTDDELGLERRLVPGDAAPTVDSLVSFAPRS
jgi:hypothetical protein